MSNQSGSRVADVPHGKVDVAYRRFAEELGPYGARVIERLAEDSEYRRKAADFLVEQLDNEQAAIFTPKRNTLVHGLFVPTDIQIANMKKWNKRFLLGISEDQFAALPTAPVWPEDRLTAVNLVYYPQQRAGKTTVQSMLETWWQILVFRHKGAWRSPLIETDEEHLRFLDGCAVPGGTLRWETINLAADWDRRNMSPVDKIGNGSAHFGVMAAAAHHKEWVQSFDGMNVPYPTIGGLQITVPNSDEWTGLLCLGWNHDDCLFGLDADDVMSEDGYWSVPSLVRK